MGRKLLTVANKLASVIADAVEDGNYNEAMRIIKACQLARKGGISEAIRENTSKAGSVKSEAKAAAARENGKKGGRPRKKCAKG